MKIFLPEGQEDHEFAQLTDPDSYPLFDELTNGTPRRDSWSPFSVRIINMGERRRALRRADAPFLFDSVLVLRPDATEVMKPFLAEHGELLPLSCEQAELVVFNALRVLDALDESASALTRFSSGRIMLVDRHVFRKQLIQDLHVFKVTSLQPSSLFVSEEFVERWRAAGLKGIEFRQVWEG